MDSIDKSLNTIEFVLTGNYRNIYKVTIQTLSNFKIRVLEQSKNETLYDINLQIDKISNLECRLKVIGLNSIFKGCFRKNTNVIKHHII
jgi:hypothetical protein